MKGLLQEKKIMFRYRGEGKFAVAKRRRQAEAIERNKVYQKQISTPFGIKEYIINSKWVGKKQYDKLQLLLKKLSLKKLTK